jgi:hypothetical protein
MDVFALENFAVREVSKETSERLLNDLITKPRLYSVPGYRYGFVDCKIINDDITYGYFTQEYLDHSIKYDDNITRQDSWDRRFANILFIWPVNTEYFILQDTRFFGIPSLDMNSTRSRVLMVMNILRERYNIPRIGDIVLRPFKRELSSEEMFDELMNSEHVVTRTRIDMSNGNTKLPEKFPVFNPREDWNDFLKQIIEEYEVPNIANATFKSTRKGTLKDSAIVKALALTGKVNYFQRGRGKYKETIKQLVPTHIGKIEVSEPITEENVGSILGFIQNNLRVILTEKPLKFDTSHKQMKFENY